MPLVRIDLRKGKQDAYRAAVSRIVHEALVSVGVPKDDRLRSNVKIGHLAMELRNTRELLANAIARARTMLLDVEVHVVGVKRVEPGPRTVVNQPQAAVRIARKYDASSAPVCLSTRIRRLSASVIAMKSTASPLA